MNKIEKMATGKRVLIFIILANVVYAVMIVITIPLVMEFSGGMRLLDMMPTGYSPAYVHTLLETLGEEGRHNYLIKQIPLDMIYPLLFGIAYALLLAFLMNRLGWPKGAFFLCALPLAAGFFDYLENISIIYMLKLYPAGTKIVAEVASVFTISKSMFSTLSFVTIIVVVVLMGVNKWRAST